MLSTLSIVGVLLPYISPPMKTNLPRYRPFGTGCVFSIAFLHLLPDALEATQKVEMPQWLGNFPLAEGLCVLGFLVMVVVEQGEKARSTFLSTPCSTLTHRSVRLPLLRN